MIKLKDYDERSKTDLSTKELLKGSIIVINKPKGPFSYEITDRVKKSLRVKKTGHAGTLDPNATGVLPIGVNKGCHLLRAISKAPKEYVGLMHVHTEVSLSQVIKSSKKLIGVITQLPPVRSAVKREEREREIYELEVIEFNKKREVKFRVLCEAGTYVRKLCTKWGELMNSRAHLRELVRTKAGPYTLDDAVSMNEFIKKPINCLKPMESAINHLGKIWVDDGTVKSISHGSQPFLPGVYKATNDVNKNDLIALLSPNQELIALGTALMSSEEMKKKNKGQVVKLERVFIQTA